MENKKEMLSIGLALLLAGIFIGYFAGRELAKKEFRREYPRAFPSALNQTTPPPASQSAGQENDILKPSAASSQ